MRRLGRHRNYPWTPDRWDPGRVRTGAIRRHVHPPGARRRFRRGCADARRHLPDELRGGCAERQVRPGDTVAVIGTGPIGLAAILTAQLFSPSQIVAIDIADSRLEAAKRFGAGVLVNSERDDALERIREITGGLGADTAIEAVGVPESFELCASLVRPGGVVANVGVHGRPATPHLEDLWIKGVTVTTGLVDTNSTPTLLKLIRSGQLDVSGSVTHRYLMDEFLEAYDTFSRAGETGALKVVLTRT